MTMKERYAVHGWNTFLPEDSPFHSDIMDIIVASGCENSARLLVGNSMHIPSVMAVLLYAFSHSSSRSAADAAAWRVARASSTSSWNLEVSAGDDDNDGSQIPSHMAWKRAKSSLFDE